MSGHKQLNADLLGRRSKVLATLDVSKIETLSRVELLRLQGLLGYGEKWGVWEIPKTWLPAGRRRPGDRILRVQCADEATDDAWEQILRFALLRTLVPKNGGIAKPSTVRTEMYAATRLIPELIARGSNETPFWSRLTVDDMERICPSVGRTLASSLIRFHRQGFLADMPGLPLRDDGTTERNRKGEPVSTHKVNDEKQFQPLPDEFTGQCGQRVLWMVKNLAPTMLDLIEAVLVTSGPPPAKNTRVPGKRTARGYKEVTRIARNQVIREWTWKDANGDVIEKMPFELNLRRRIASGMGSAEGDPTHENFAWPPRGLSDLLPLMRLLQTAHAWIILLTSGPRASTVASFEEDCLVPVAGGGFRIKGTYFKTTDQRSGQVRDWPAPPIVIQTIRQQTRLARLFKRWGNPSDPASLGNHLWVLTSNMAAGRGSPLSDFSADLDIMVDRFNLRQLLGEDAPRLHTHRFRKTLARIVALTLTNAQMILMDCFGHDDPEMTLHRYILSDPMILADVQKVQRELVILLAKDAVENSDTLGGAMGVRVRQAKAEFLRLHVKNALDPADVFELAESLTLGGREWIVVMPGVLCTLPVGYTGPCAARQGGRNPGNCQSGCNHQLLTAFHKTECDDMVTYILQQLQRAVNEGAELMVAMWQGQLRNWLYRWRPVFQKWSGHPLVVRYGDSTINSEAIPL